MHYRVNCKHTHPIPRTHSPLLADRKCVQYILCAFLAYSEIWFGCADSTAHVDPPYFCTSWYAVMYSSWAAVLRGQSTASLVKVNTADGTPIQTDMYKSRHGQMLIIIIVNIVSRCAFYYNVYIATTFQADTVIIMNSINATMQHVERIICVRQERRVWLERQCVLSLIAFRCFLHDHRHDYNTICLTAHSFSNSTLQDRVVQRW